jgi:nucleotide-binding universal stress UspA family protein
MSRRSIEAGPDSHRHRAEHPEPIRVFESHPGVESETHIVVGFDEESQSQAALTVALDLAHRLGAHLDVVHVVDLRDSPLDPDADDWESATDSALAQTAEHVRAAVDSHTQHWTHHAWRGDPVHLLATVAEESGALMIVVGTHGAGFAAAFHRMMGGSVSRGLVGHSHIPVLIVPPGTD